MTQIWVKFDISLQMTHDILKIAILSLDRFGSLRGS